MNLDDIREHWEQMGRQFRDGAAVTPTSRDPYLGMLEEEKILRHLDSEKECLEVGCGDASHSLVYAKAVKSIVGVDVAQSLVDRAHEKVEASGVKNLRVTASSVLDVGSVVGPASVDCVISQRCLINLPTWEDQKAALLQLHEVLRDGALLLLTEGFERELQNLNVVRQQMNLVPINTVEYNRNMEREEFEVFVGEHFHIVEISGYSLYLVMSRVLHPVLVAPEAPRHEAKVNEIAMRLSAACGGDWPLDYSYNLFYALQKKCP